MIKDILDFQKQPEQEEQRDKKDVNPYLSPKEFAKRKIKKKITSSIKKKATEKILTQLAKKLSEEALKKVIFVASKTPWGLIIVLILLFLLVFFYIMFGMFRGGGGSEQEEEEAVPIVGTPGEPQIPGLTVTKTGDSQISFGENITYSISANYNESVGGIPIDKIVMVDKLPENAEFVSATGTYVHSGNTIEWPLTTGTTSYSFTLVVKPTIDNVEIINTINGRSLVPGSKMIDSSAANLQAIFEDAANVANVPAALLKAIAKTESGVLEYSSDEVSQFNANLWWSGLPDDAPTLDQLPQLIRRGYAYNTCAFPKSDPICPGADVRGAMQFELGTWNGLKSLLSFADGHDPDRRYVRDIIYAAAYFIRGKIDQYDSRFSFTSSLSSLSETQVKALAKSYCGGNPDADTNQAACGYGRHEANVWAYYQEYNAN